MTLNTWGQYFILIHPRKLYKEVILLTPLVFTQLLPNQKMLWYRCAQHPKIPLFWLLLTSKWELCYIPKAMNRTEIYFLFANILISLPFVFNEVRVSLCLLLFVLVAKKKFVCLETYYECCWIRIISSFSAINRIIFWNLQRNFRWMLRVNK